MKTFRTDCFLKLLAFLSLPRDSAVVVLNEDEPYERRDALC